MKKYKVKIWDDNLICPICNNKLFYFKKIKIEDYDQPYEHEIRYLFECDKCGHGMMIGAITKWEPEEKLNFSLVEV
ncbi:hypothetical protein [Faecalispora jeddahensis]|uniref:hypothetical protein n=1 Tax=Faecalispora jeddahensis TaxID=1414721 RepID=UPI0028AA193C|nr:hypothetical protein [Faecalispora jeddahensis]